MRGTVRTLKPETRDFAEKRIKEITNGIATSFGAKADVNLTRGYPVTSNHEKQTEFAVSVAKEVAGDTVVADDAPPVMGGEDFSFMLEERPGAFIFAGNGERWR